MMKMGTRNYLQRFLFVLHAGIGLHIYAMNSTSETAIMIIPAIME